MPLFLIPLYVGVCLSFYCFFWLCDFVTTVTPLIKRSEVKFYKGVAVVTQKNQKTSKTTSRDQHKVEYITGKFFLFNSLEENLDLML